MSEVGGGYKIATLYTASNPAPDIYSITGFRDWLFQLGRRPVSTETNSMQEEQFGYYSNNEGAA
jgi:hypothetical protein